jgi:RNA polymerase sigma factor (sigma-70 family)
MHNLHSDPDLTRLYTTLAGPLERIVRLDVRAPDVVVEDACQFAWARLIDRGRGVRQEATLSWLATTAVREALKLISRRQRELSLEAALDQLGEASMPPSPEQPHLRLDLLDGMRALPARQQRFLWMQALGLSYAEMAAREQCTLRTVERQVLRAKHGFRAAYEGAPVDDDSAGGLQALGVVRAAP